MAHVVWCGGGGIVGLSRKNEEAAVVEGAEGGGNWDVSSRRFGHACHTEPLAAQVGFHASSFSRTPAPAGCADHVECCLRLTPADVEKRQHAAAFSVIFCFGGPKYKMPERCAGQVRQTQQLRDQVCMNANVLASEFSFPNLVAFSHSSPQNGILRPRSPCL